MNYDNARKAVLQAFPGMNPKQFKLTQSFLRVELPLAVGSSLYNFNILKNDGSAFETEKRLNLQDSFIPSEVMFYTSFPTSATDTRFRPYLYPNTQVIAAANLDDYLSLWTTGTMSITVNRNVLVPDWDLWQHYYAGETQQTAALGAGSPGDQLRGCDDGFAPMQPNVVMIGSKNTQLQIQMPVGLAAVETYSRIGLWFRGHLAQNSTVVS